MKQVEIQRTHRPLAKCSGEMWEAKVAHGGEPHKQHCDCHSVDIISEPECTASLHSEKVNLPLFYHEHFFHPSHGAEH